MIIFCSSLCNRAGVFICFGVGGEFLMIVFNSDCLLINFIMITLFYFSLIVIVPSFCGEGSIISVTFAVSVLHYLSVVVMVFCHSVGRYF
jgi:hypothetical protein